MDRVDIIERWGMLELPVRAASEEIENEQVIVFCRKGQLESACAEYGG